MLWKIVLRIKMKVDLSNCWSLNDSDVYSEISHTTNEIENYLKNRNDFIENELFQLIIDIKNVIQYWVGNTYVGMPKNKKLRNYYQAFWCSLYNLIIDININSNKYNSSEKLTLGSLLYEGPIYRYIGHGDSQDNTKIEIKYNDIFVSWSKCEKVHYLEEKLYGDYYWISGNTNKEHYGIDLEKINLSKPYEREVVFPTIKDCITEVRLIKEDEYE